jgi:hypothetical protein
MALIPSKALTGIAALTFAAAWRHLFRRSRPRRTKLNLIS